MVEGAKKYVPKVHLFDIAANLADGRFSGYYHHKQQHKADLDVVLERAKFHSVDKLLIAGTYIKDSLDSYNIAKMNENYYSTIGVHPCRAAEPAKEKQTIEEYFNHIDKFLEEKIGEGKVVAIGECGLDYDRLNFANKETQLQVFPPHFDLANKYKLPMYLHCRNTHGDFLRLVKENRDKFEGGVVHSFTGNIEELKELLSLDLYIGINGCSLKTEDNLAVVKEVPLERLCLETDSPYCDIRNTHAGAKHIVTKFPRVKKEKYNPEKMIKERNEPCTIVQVLEVVSAVKEVKKEILAQHAWDNSLKVFNLYPV